MAGFIAVHCGAGYHSDSLKKEYKKLCNAACKRAYESVKHSGTAMDAVEVAIKVLENSPLTNAGYGSNLSWHGNVECDASIMNGQTLHFGACGAVSNVLNPIGLARRLCNRQCDPLSLGRVPPCILTGPGAKVWAQKSGLEIVEGGMMVSPRAYKNYKHCKKKLKKYSEQFEVRFSPLDTVGAICVDSNGTVVAGVSSGGLPLKHEGRIGQAASFASGVWAAKTTAKCKYSIASCTSGCGEHLIRTQLARRTAECLSQNCPTTALSTCLQEDFCDSPFLWDVPEKLGGVIALRHDPLDGSGEFLWGHSTLSMCIGYMSCTDNQPKFVMSYLPPNVKAGSKAVVGGLPFTIPIQPQPVVLWELKTD